MTLQAVLPVFASLAFITALAAAIEGLVEYFVGNIVDNVPRLKPLKKWLMYVPIVVCVPVAYFYGLDLFALLASFLELEGLAEATVVGIGFTGVLMARGSNYIHDFWKRWFVKPE